MTELARLPDGSGVVCERVRHDSKFWMSKWKDGGRCYLLFTKMWMTTRQAEGRWGRVKIRSLVWGEVRFEMPIKYII